MNFLYRLRDQMVRFMMGRYGQDQFALFLLISAVALSVLSGIPYLELLMIPSYALLIYGIYRMFSKKITQRRKENQAFLTLWNKLPNWIRRKKQNAAERKVYVQFKCPRCKMKLRAPKGKGHIRVTCPSCKKVFDKTV